MPKTIRKVIRSIEISNGDNEFFTIGPIAPEESLFYVNFSVGTDDATNGHNLMVAISVFKDSPELDGTSWEAGQSLAAGISASPDYFVVRLQPGDMSVVSIPVMLPSSTDFRFCQVAVDASDVSSGEIYGNMTFDIRTGVA